MEYSASDDEDLDLKLWNFYRFENDATPGWPSLLESVGSEKSKLINIISDICVMMYGNTSTKITAQDILRHYARFKAWNDALPESITGFEKGSQALPHVLNML